MSKKTIITYENVLAKVRRLSLMERKKLAEQDINPLSHALKDQDKVIFAVLALMFTEDEIATIDTLERENEITNKIFNLTYVGASEQAIKN